MKSAIFNTLILQVKYMFILQVRLVHKLSWTIGCFLAFNFFRHFLDNGLVESLSMLQTNTELLTQTRYHCIVHSSDIFGIPCKTVHSSLYVCAVRKQILLVKWIILVFLPLRFCVRHVPCEDTKIVRVGSRVLKVQYVIDNKPRGWKVRKFYWVRG